MPAVKVRKFIVTVEDILHEGVVAAIECTVTVIHRNPARALPFSGDRISIARHNELWKS